MATKIDTVTARAGLKARHAPYWHKLRAECHLGFRKTTPDSVGSWIARCRDRDGKYRLHSLGSLEAVSGGVRFDEASRLASEWFAHLEKGGSIEAKTIKDVCDAYVEQQRQENSEKAAQDAQRRFNAYVLDDASLAALEVTKLTPAHVDSWRKKLAQSPVRQGLRGTRRKADGYAIERLKKTRSQSTLNRDITPFRAALNLAFENGWVTSDFAWRSKLKPIKDADKKRGLYLDREQRAELIKHAARDLANLLRGMSMLPVRPGALALLTVAQFEKRQGVLMVGKDKAGGARNIKLPSATAEFFAEQCKGKLGGAPIFTRADGMAWNKDSWKEPIREAVKAAKMPTGTTAYTLRHSVITDLVHGGLDLLTVAQISGTSVMMIERHYGHLRGEIASSALAALVL